MSKIQWTGRGWYKENDAGVFTKIAPAEASHLDAEKIAGDEAAVWFFKSLPHDMEQAPLDNILPLLDLGDDW